MSVRVGSPIALKPTGELTVSRRAEDEIFVSGDERLFKLGWGGTRNHIVLWVRDAWEVHHLGHSSPIWINDQPTRERHRLASGDRVAPARGFVFTFTLRPDLEPLAEELQRLDWRPMTDERVLCDWVMERTSLDREAASLACDHLMTRSGAGRTG